MMAIEIQSLPPSGNVTKVYIDRAFLEDCWSLFRMADLHVIGSEHASDGTSVCLVLQGPIVPDAEFCQILVSKTFVPWDREAIGVGAGVKVSLVAVERSVLARPITTTLKMALDRGVRELVAMDLGAGIADQRGGMQDRYNAT